LFPRVPRSPRHSKRTAPLRKVTHLTAQKHAVSGRLKRRMAFSAFIIAGNPVGTVIAIYLLERMMKERLIKYE
jgi:hypothetical protein